ncbi:hematopoietic progenitor cell antigen CD34 isoform X2 [Colius striatus]|nr:hematopoietic progenitor cell antigen CD34 isoform X2 [Colius striatus]
MAVESRGTSSTAAPAAPEATTAPTVPAAPSSSGTATDTSATSGSGAASPSSPGLSSEGTSPQPSRAPTLALGTPLDTDHTSQGVPTAESPVTQLSPTAKAPVTMPALTSTPATSGHPPVPAATTAATTARHPVKDSPKPITCHNVKEVSATEAICLQLNESSTCKHFLETKGSDLWSAVCEERAHRAPSPCHIQLATSEVHRDCLLLILTGDTDPTTDVLQESHWEKFGIKSLKRERVRSHQDFSQKTLIALVTSGLLLAFLGLAGYFLMKRRSWSPAGERLAEDPYYTENGSQGNTMLMSPQEQPELQEKPNLNGGTQENGTGQASSKNGHSARHSPADTEM